MSHSDELISHLNQALITNPALDLPRYRQLYEALRQQILLGILPPETRLPSSRHLAQALNLARNTVLTAIEQLCAEGYAIARPGSGIYIVATAPAAWQTAPPTLASRSPGLSTRGSNMIAPLHSSAIRGAFATGVPDLKAFPFELWQRYVGRHARNPKLDWQNYTFRGGHEELRQAIADYLYIARGIRCSAEQILITHGTQQSLRLLADLLADPGDVVWMEDPGYLGAHCAFAAAGLNVVSQPVDAEGLAPDLTVSQQSPRLIYTTPSHQYPTAVVMTAARRRHLLALAAKHQAWLLEDDYDSEFRYTGTPLAALQALAPQQVIYMGTFSKTFFPALGIAYLVVPETWIEAFRAAQARHQREPSYVIQKALADFIRDGHASAYIRKMRREYQTRRDTLVDLLRVELGNELRLEGLDTGLHLLAYLPDDQKLSIQAQQFGVITKALSSCYAPETTQRSSALILGFGDPDVPNILRAGKILCQIILGGRFPKTHRQSIPGVDSNNCHR